MTLLFPMKRSIILPGLVLLSCMSSQTLSSLRAESPSFCFSNAQPRVHVSYQTSLCLRSQCSVLWSVHPPCHDTWTCRLYSVSVQARDDGRQGPGDRTQEPCREQARSTALRPPNPRYQQSGSLCSTKVPRDTAPSLSAWALVGETDTYTNASHTRQAVMSASRVREAGDSDSRVKGGLGLERWRLGMKWAGI